MEGVEHSRFALQPPPTKSFLSLCLCLGGSVGSVPKNTKKAKKARNAKKAAGKALREEVVDRRAPGGSAESEAGPYRQVIARHICM